ncbi:CarD family transcriptional regulator [Oceanobacillus sp. CAU 1775]
MFQVGDNIVYPMHGAGIIEGIEEKEVRGKEQEYYVIKMLIGNMQVMVPSANMKMLRIRPVTNLDAMTQIKSVFNTEDSSNLLPWKQRYKVNMEKIKTGKLEDCVEVVRDLIFMKKQEGLNTSEKKMLSDAQEFMISELELIEGLTTNQIKSFS